MNGASLSILDQVLIQHTGNRSQPCLPMAVYFIMPLSEEAAEAEKTFTFLIKTKWVLGANQKYYHHTSIPRPMISHLLFMQMGERYSLPLLDALVSVVTIFM